VNKLTVAECRAFIQAVSEKAAEMGVPISVAVVGPEGHLIALERMDAAGFITPDIARAKAYTAVAFRSMSPRFTDGLVIQQWFKERNPQMLANASVFTNGQVVASGGTTPVFKEDDLVGGYASAAPPATRTRRSVATHERRSVGRRLRQTTPRRRASRTTSMRSTQRWGSAAGASEPDSQAWGQRDCSPSIQAPGASDRPSSSW
jgi:glc operon protein GlcG